MPFLHIPFAKKVEKKPPECPPKGKVVRFCHLGDQNLKSHPKNHLKSHPESYLESRHLNLPWPSTVSPTPRPPGVPVAFGVG